MIPYQHKKKIIAAVKEARSKGARLYRCADEIGLSRRTLQRWMHEVRPDRRKGSERRNPRKLNAEERKQVLQTVCQPRFQDSYPAEIVAILASEGIYIASQASFYRILREERLLSHRRKSKAPIRKEKPRLKATAADQVYSWDITYMKTDITGIYYYLYLVVDIFSRYIVHHEVHETESSARAASMLRSIADMRYVKGLTLHSDNGAPMKGYNMLATMQALQITPSFSRPSVSTDNPYSESLFRTLKYMPDYPERFSSLRDASDWVDKFVNWYNYRHLHSGIDFVTPHDRHYGKDDSLLSKRRETFEKARQRNPLRWSKHAKKWQKKEVVYINAPDSIVDSRKAS